MKKTHLIFFFTILLSIALLTAGCEKSTPLKTEDGQSQPPASTEAKSDNTKSNNTENEILPDRTKQVIMTTNAQITEADDYFSIVYIPNIEIGGNEKAAQAINTYAPLTQIIENAQTNAQTYLEYAKNTTFNDQLTIYTFESSAYSTQTALSLTLSEFLYAAGAVHHDSSCSSFIFDTETGERLLLVGMLDAENTDAYNQLRSILIGAMEKADIYANSSLDEVVDCLLANKPYDGSDLSDVPMLTRDGLKLQFSLFDIAPFPAGEQSTLIPYSELKGIIDEKYLPSATTSDGVLEVYAKDAKDMPKLSTTHGNESERALTVTGTVWDISITESKTLPNSNEPYSSYGGMTFYANFLTEELYWLPDGNQGSITLFYNGTSKTY